MSSPQPHRPVKSADLDTLKQQQLDATLSDDGRGDIEHVAGNTAEGQKADYQLPATEQHLLHVELATFTRKVGTRDFDRAAKVVQLSPAEFERMEKNDSFAEYQGEDGEVNILHDPRSKARQKADQTGDAPTGSPAEANKPLTSLQDAQMRYKELTKQDAPTNVSFEELVALIAPLEAKLKAEASTTGLTGTADNPARVLRTKADYQARYKELAGEEAPAEKTIEELKQAIAHFEANPK
ncbi:hypothetical protein [Hymenobacter nivis]|uniref:Uncharacterized protein n=1 Tax=Hymenobacter nivis TaxID=1850093 RepID=A0A502GX29_9BACT|nr:hypothetical protein [Hymenobacter nivis]TPG66075.1 hypothetical protein EAH73_11945 [Hymenobacter nivis]